MEILIGVEILETFITTILVQSIRIYNDDKILH